jgi:hypothetical protein
MKFTILLLSERSCFPGGVDVLCGGEGEEVVEEGAGLGGGAFSAISGAFGGGALRGDLNRSRCFANGGGVVGEG